MFHLLDIFKDTIILPVALCCINSSVVCFYSVFEEDVMSFVPQPSATSGRSASPMETSNESPHSSPSKSCAHDKKGYGPGPSCSKHR